MDDFLTSLNESVSNGIQNMRSQIIMMKNRYPSSAADSMDIWDDVMINRSMLLDRLPSVMNDNVVSSRFYSDRSKPALTLITGTTA